MDLKKLDELPSGRSGSLMEEADRELSLTHSETRTARMSYWILGLVLFIFILNFLGNIEGWYWSFLWYDTPMHIMGGFWLALFLTYLKSRIEKRGDAAFLWQSVWSLLISVLTIGLAWECFEYGVDIIVAHQYTLATIPHAIIFDSVKDLFNDLFGGLIFFAGLRYFGNVRATSSVPSKK